MKICITPDPFDPWAVLGQFENRSLKVGSYGACASFIGTMRDFNQGDSVESMCLDYYPAMTEKLLKDHAQGMVEQYGLLDLLIVHRVGQVFPNDPIVLVAAWSAHRVQAFDGCRQMMEHLKSKATFWKKETLKEGSTNRWVGNFDRADTPA